MSTHYDAHLLHHISKAAAQKHESVLKNITEEHTRLKDLVDTVRATEIDLTTALDKYMKVRLHVPYSFECLR
jgi:hypothetical protein